MTGLLTAALMLAAAYSLGAAALARLPRLVLDGTARRLAFRTGLGLGLLAYLVLALGLPGLLRPWVGWLLLAASLLSGAGTLRAEAARLRRQRANTAQTPLTFSRDERFPHVVAGSDLLPRAATAAIMVGLAVVAAALVLVALAPPAGYDELTYHLAAPKVFARTGAVRILPYDHHTAFSFTLEMLYTLGLLVGNAATAKLLHLALWGLSLLALYSLGRDFLGQATGWLAVAVFGFTPLALTHAPLAYTEFGLALWSLLALIAFAEYLNLRATAVRQQGGQVTPQARQPQWLVLVGLCGGLCYGVKPTALLLTVWLVGAVVVLGRADRLAGRAIRSDALVVALLAALVACPWALRSWVVTGNPVFPFAQGVFRSRLWTAERARVYDQAQKEFGRALREDTLAPLEPSGPQHGLARLVTLPWNVTFHPTWFFDIGLNFDGKARIGPAFLALGLPAAAMLGCVAVLRRRRRWLPGYEELRDEQVEQVYSREFGRDVPVPRTRAITERVTVNTPRLLGLLLGYALFVTLFWFVTMQHLRYLAPTLAVVAVLAGWAAAGLLRLRLSAVAVVVVLLAQAAGGLAYAGAYAVPAWRVLAGTLAPERYCAEPAYRAMQFVNQLHPAGRVMLLGEPRGYWLDGPYLWGERNHSVLIPDAAYADSTRYLDFVRDKLGVSHLLVATYGFPLAEPTPPGETSLVAQGIREGRLQQVYADERGVLVLALR